MIFGATRVIRVIRVVGVIGVFMGGLLAGPALAAPLQNDIVVIVPTPKESLPRIRAFLDYLALAFQEFSPRELRRSTHPLNIDPFSLEELERIGLDLGKPLVLWEGRKLALRSLQPRPRSGPAVDSAASVNRADVWISSRSSAGAGFERVDAAIWLAPGRATMRAHVAIDPSTSGISTNTSGDTRVGARVGDLLSAIAGPNHPSARIFEIPRDTPIAGEFTAQVDPDRLSRALGSLSSDGLGLGFTHEHARALSGSLHVAFTGDGTVTAAAGLSKNANHESLRILQARLTSHLRTATTTISQSPSGRAMLVTLGGRRPPSLGPASKERRPPFSLEVAPRLIVPALRGFKGWSGHDDFGLGSARLMMIEMLFGRLLQATERVKIEVTSHASRCEISIALDYAPH